MMTSYFHQESDRLKFRKLTRDDIPQWTEFFIQNDRLRFLGIDLTKSPEAQATDWIEKQFDCYEQQGLGHLAVELKGTHTFIGLGGILPRTMGNRQEYEIAYSLLPQYWQKGYGTELARQMKSYGWAHIPTDRFISLIHKENTSSIRVAVKNGMRILFETQFLGMDVFVYGIETDRLNCK